MNIDQSLVDTLWIVVAAGEVFLMQAGFIFLEVGQVRPQNALSVTVKNVLDWLVVSLVYVSLGFGLMYSASSSGLIGEISAIVDIDGLSVADGAFVLFQLAFAGTAVTIMSGAIAGRTGHWAYIISVIFVALLVYPVFGYWVWGNLYVSSNEPWLVSMGFHDFAGSAVVHSIGGWCGLMGAIVVGPRLGRFDAQGKPSNMSQFSLAWAFAGVLILWLGWWGFNGGSVGSFNADTMRVILRTNFAGAAGGLAALMHSHWLGDRSYNYAKLAGGIIAGLVAITASADIASAASALCLGAVAGVLHNYAYDFLLFRVKVDDPVGAVAAHGFGGLVGTLAVPFVARSGTLSLPFWEQLGVQALGAVVCFVWAAGMSYGLFLLLKKYVGLRVSPAEEIGGIHLGFQQIHGGESSDESASIDADELADLL